jgi:hypothetical protein
VSARDDLIKGLRDLADWLETHPDAPLGAHDGAHVQHSAPAEPDRKTAKRALDRAAAALGLNAGPMFGGDEDYYGFSVMFGPVRYQAVSLKDEEDDQ